jgi:flagella basal body P-ring formation protein FlgA
MTGSLTRRAAGLAAALLVLAAGPRPARAELSEQELRDQIERFALPYAGAPPFALEIPSVRDFSEASAPFGPVDVRLSTLVSQPGFGSLPVTVSLESSGREFKRGVVTVRLRPEQPVLVAARPIEAGTVIREEDLREEIVADARPVPGRIEQRSEAVGRRATRALRAGTVLRHDLVGEVPVVARGDTVTIRLERGPLRIEALGRAREDAAVGAPVRVLNLESRREVVGIVKEDGVVHVGF